MRPRYWIVLVLLAVVALAGMDRCQRAEAFPAFLREFQQKYVLKDTPLYKAYNGKATCNVCHVGGTLDRQHRNAYGQAVDRLLDKSDADALSFAAKMRDPQEFAATEQKVRQALEKVEVQPSDERKQKSPTFGELIRRGLLPLSPNVLSE